jgi:hypothetical protein
MLLVCAYPQGVDRGGEGVGEGLDLRPRLSRRLSGVGE